MTGRLLRSEYRKLTSTNTWWIFGIGVVVTTAVALLVNINSAIDDMNLAGIGRAGQDNGAPATVGYELVQHAPDVYTSGQFFSGLFIMLLSVLMITNEYHHQTATATFLVTPRRDRVVTSKLVMSMLVAAATWVVITVLDVAVGAPTLSGRAGDTGLAAWSAQRAIVVNLMVLALWGLFGIGLGALLRSQIGATITASVLYSIGVFGVYLVIGVIRETIYHNDAVWRLLVVYPYFAAQIAATPGTTHLPNGQRVAWWVGALVMLVYGLAMGAIGTAIIRRRDVS